MSKEKRQKGKLNLFKKIVVDLLENKKSLRNALKDASEIFISFKSLSKRDFQDILDDEFVN